jgi:hypothetical protein
VEPVAQLGVNLPRVYEVCASESIAVIQHKAVVRKGHPVQGDGPFLSQVLAQGKVNRGMGRQMSRAIAVQEA